MPLRVTDTQVKAIIDTNRDLAPFIEVANLLVDEILSSAALSATRLEKVELYLAAHFAAISEERGSLIVSKLGESTEVMADHYSEGLRLTRYGQQAIALDTSGKLATIASAKNKAELKLV